MSSLTFPSCRHFISIRCCSLSAGGCRALANKAGGRELDAFNGNVVKNLILHSETASRTKTSCLARKADTMRKQKQELKRFIPQPIFGKIKASAVRTKDMKFDNVHEVNRFILDHLSRSSTGNVADLMHISVKVSKKSKKMSYLRVHLPVIAAKLKTFPAADWNFRDISTIVYGLQCFKVDDDGVIDILSLMCTLVEHGINEKQLIKSQDVSMLLLGLQKMCSSREEVSKFLSLITIMVTGCDDHFNEQNIGNALLGLQSMTNNSQGRESLMLSLAKKIHESPSEMSSQAVNNSLLGLQGMRSECTGVRAIISALADKIKECRPELSSQALSNSFCSLQGMSSDCVEVQNLLSSLTFKAKHSVRNFDSQEMGNALYGLQRMRTDSVAVRDALSALLIKLKFRKEDMTGHAICDSFYGLQGMNSDCTEVKELLSALARQFQNCKDKLSSRDVSNALYGLQDLGGVIRKEDHILILSVLFENVNRIICGEDSIIPNCNGLVFNNLIKLHEAITLIQSNLPTILKQNHYKSWEKINRFLADEITLRRRDGCNYYDQNNDDTDAEKKMNSMIGRKFNSSNISMKSNEFLFDLFKCDFLFKILVPDIVEKEKIITLILNIEINDSTRIIDKNSNKNYDKNYCLRRDQYLRSRNIVVVRLESSFILSITVEELEEWMKRTLANVQTQHTIDILGLSDEMRAINAL